LKARRKDTTRKAKTLCGFKMDLKEIRWDGVDWIYMAQDRNQWRALVTTILNLRVP
jgi:hypothetical protein